MSSDYEFDRFINFIKFHKISVGMSIFEIILYLVVAVLDDNDDTWGFFFFGLVLFVIFVWVKWKFFIVLGNKLLEDYKTLTEKYP